MKEGKVKKDKWTVTKEIAYKHAFLLHEKMKLEQLEKKDVKIELKEYLKTSGDSLNRKG